MHARSLLFAALLSLAACRDEAAPARDAAADVALDVTPDTKVDAAVDDGPAERALPPSRRTLSDLVGFSLPGRDLPIGSAPAAVARRAWAVRALRDIGLHRVRREVFWSEVEPSQGAFSWAAYDDVMRELAAANVSVLGVLAYGNRWAASAPGADDYYPPDDPATFARFAAEAARRYHDTVRDWEIWNEPNAGFRFWRPSLRGDPAAFGALVEAARISIRAVDPGARVAYGGTVFLPQVLTGGVEFARQSFEATPGLARSLAAFAMHAYTAYPPRAAPEADDAIEVSHARKVAQMAAMLDAQGYALDRPLWVTETGWPVTQAVTEELQARWLVRTVLLSALAGVDGVWLYELGDGPSMRELVPEDSFGVFRYDADPTDAVEPAPKPSAIALRALFARLGAFRVVGREVMEGAPPDVHALSLERADGARARVAWRADDRAPPWMWPVDADAQLVAMDGAPVTASSGRVAVGGAPVYALLR